MTSNIDHEYRSVMITTYLISTLMRLDIIGERPPYMSVKIFVCRHKMH